jgi:hypothetical protein
MNTGSDKFGWKNVRYKFDAGTVLSKYRTWRLVDCIFKTGPVHFIFGPARTGCHH